MADDPLLTDRSGLPRRRKLLRVILDSYLRIPPESRCDSDRASKMFWCCVRRRKNSRRRRWKQKEFAYNR